MIYLWDTAKAPLRGKFRTIKSYIRKEEKSKIKDLILHLKQLEKEQTKPRVTRRKETIKIETDVNAIENRTIEKINETKSSFFEKINKSDKPLTRLNKEKRERTQINKIRNEKGEVTTDTTETQRTISDYCKQLFASKMDNLREMDKFLERYNFQRLKHVEIENMNA